MSMSRSIRKLKDFLVERYPHRVSNSFDGPWTDEAVVQTAITLLTPGDGSDAAWERMRAARGDYGVAAQYALVVQTAAALTETSAVQTSYGHA